MAESYYGSGKKGYEKSLHGELFSRSEERILSWNN